MNVLLINGSPRPSGNTRRALDEVASELHKYDVSTEVYWIGNKAVQGCTACGKCKETGVCVFNTGVYNDLFNKIQEVDAIIVGSPTYYAGPAGSLCALLDRLFYSAGRFLHGKPGAAVGIARRAGAVETVQRLNLYFEINSMPVITSQYWNLAFGATPNEVEQDAEGLQTMRTLGYNMARALYGLAGKGSLEKLDEEPWQRTNFIR